MVFLVLFRERGVKLFRDMTSSGHKTDDLDELHVFQTHADATEKAEEVCRAKGLSQYEDRYLNRLVVLPGVYPRPT